MLLIVGVVLVLIAFGIPMMRVSESVTASPLGWMSAQWLAEHRASHER